MSIRARMTLWYTALLALLLLFIGLAVYILLSRNLYRAVDQTVSFRAREVSNAIAEVLTARSDPLTYLLRERVVLPRIDVFASPGLYVQVLTEDGQILAKSDNLGDQLLPLTPAQRALLVAEEEDQLVTLTTEDIPLRLISVPIAWRGNVVGVVQVARSLQDVGETLAELRVLLLSSSGVGLLVALLGGTWLARRALRPIDTITRTAHGIVEAQDLVQRLDYHGPMDEMGRLVTTFNQMLGRIESLFGTQQRFIADVSHELRTPLTTVQGYLDLLQRDEVQANPEERAEILGTIQSEVARMGRLSADLLLLAQAEAGIELSMRPVELDTILLNVYRQAKTLASDVDVLMGGEDQAVVLGDPDRLKQLLLNLVDNALKYTPAGGTVTLSLVRETSGSEAGWARIEVSDTGVGIPSEDLPHIFERFYRVDRSRSSRRGGTGLGLSIARWIAQAHGGRISATSRVGKGSTFVVRIPLAGP